MLLFDIMVEYVSQTRVYKFREKQSFHQMAKIPNVVTVGAEFQLLFFDIKILLFLDANLIF